MNWTFTVTGAILLVVMSCIFGSSICYAQKPLSKPVTISVNSLPVAEVLKTISQNGDFYFSYNSDIIPGDSLVTLTIRDKTVKQVLDLLFQAKFQYKEKGNYIILQRAPLEKSYVISGHIFDNASGLPADYVSVYSRLLLVSALTNDNGGFRLRVKDTNFPVQLTVSKVGYGDTTVVVNQSESADFKIGISLKAITLDPLIVRYSDGTWLSRLLVSGRLRRQSQNIGQFFVSLPYQASLTPGLGTHGRMSSQVVNKFSLNLLGGYTAGVKGAEIAGGFNISKTDVKYAQIAGGFNQVSGRVVGAQVAGFMNYVVDSLKGVQVSGFAGIVRKDFQGVQLSGVLGGTRGNVEGVQISGGLSVSGDQSRGVQVSGFGNFVSGSYGGVQIAGAVNRVKSDLAGAQVTGFMNLTGGEMTGLQFGVVNYAAKLKGTQLGLINIADSSAGYSIGIINIIRKGNSNISLYSNEIVPFNIAWKMGNRKFYTMLVGGATANNNKKAYTFGFGVGREFLVQKKLGFFAELLNQNIYAGSWEDTPFILRLQTAVNLKINNRLSVFAGPAYSLYYGGANSVKPGYKSFPLTSYPGSDSGKQNASWLGWQGGVSWRYGRL